MIDWLTLRLPRELIDPEVHAKLTRKHSLIMQIDPDGLVEWERPSRRSVRSDSHQLTVEICGDLRIYGSPARVGLDTTHNVFGSGNPAECAQRMIDFLKLIEGIDLPSYENWSCSRIDITHNFDLCNLTNVKTALEILRNAEGGRYQVRATAESVYWSVKSTIKSGKAYSKGAHTRYLAQRGRPELSEEQQTKADGLLRLELSLRRHFFTRQLKQDWHTLTERQLDDMHTEYFGKLIGDVSISEQADIRTACIHAAISLDYSEGLGKAAYLSWMTIRNEGYQCWRDYTAKSTFYRHKAILNKAGLNYADFAARNVVPLRVHKLHLSKPVRCWADIKRAA